MYKAEVEWENNLYNFSLLQPSCLQINHFFGNTLYCIRSDFPKLKMFVFFYSVLLLIKYEYLFTHTHLQQPVIHTLPLTKMMNEEGSPVMSVHSIFTFLC